MPHEMREVLQPDGVVGLLPVPAPEKSMLLVFINSRSGAAQGEAVLRGLCSRLNRHQIWDLADGGPKAGLEMFRETPNVRVIACGGDGTFGWLQSAIDAAQMKHRPFCAHFPLGTGNDMSRSLGWGPGYAGGDLKQVLLDFIRAGVAVLDRWRVTFDGEPHGYTPAMNNYFGIGVDALIAHNFHTAREANPERFTNRALNKVKYVSLGVTTTLKELNKILQLFCDDVEVAIPDNCQSIAVLNLPNYAAGMNLWNDADSKQLIGDGLMEVVSLRGSMDVGLAAVGIKPARLAQCKKIRFVVAKQLPCQLDGEPWLQDPCTIEISLLNQVGVLVAPSQANEADADRALELNNFLNDDADDGDYQL